MMSESTITSDQPIHLCEVQIQDLPALSIMGGRLFHEAYTGMMPEQDLQEYVATAFSPEKVRAEFLQPGVTFLVAKYEGEWAGYAKLNTNKRKESKEVERFIELERLYLFKKFQGKKIGAQLMEYCLHFAKEKGFDTLWLNVWEQNKTAIGFYEKWQFEYVDWTIMMRGNDPQKALWMRKILK